MAVGFLYCGPNELAAYSRDTSAGNADEGHYEAAVVAASRAVDAWCGRRFYLDDDESARVFVYRGGRVLVDDFVQTAGLIVKTDEDGDGTFETTWTITTDFRLAPFNSIGSSGEGWPFYELVATGSRAFPCNWYSLPSIQVTAQWGWPQPFPPAVRQATLILGAKLIGLRGAPLGVAGFGEFGAVRVQGNRDVEMLLSPYRRMDVMAGIA